MRDSNVTAEKVSPKRLHMLEMPFSVKAELLELVQQRAETVRTAGHPVPIRAICQRLNKSENSLRTCPRIGAFLKQVAASHRSARLEGDR
jgi:hypothetical protein